jgi:hypothetical protein
MNGDSSVWMNVRLIASATEPWPMKVNRFDDTPAGTAPSRIVPAARSFL